MENTKGRRCNKHNDSEGMEEKGFRFRPRSVRPSRVRRPRRRRRRKALCAKLQSAVRRRSRRRNRDNCVTLPPALQSQSPPRSVVKRHFEKCTSNDSYLAIMVPAWP